MAEQPKNSIETIQQTYQRPKDFKESLFAQFVGIEVLRRLIGIAQLPLSLDLASKKQLMERAAGWILSKKLVL